MGQQFGTLALSMGGKLIGGAIGGPIGAMVGGLAGGIIGSLIFQKKNKPLIPDYQLANSSYGHTIPIIYGQERLPGTCIWETKIDTSSHGAGGKGMAGGSTYSYKQSAAFAFCQGPATPLKLWLDGKLFYDATSTNPQELTKYKFPVRIYTGTETQMPDPLIDVWVLQNAMPPNSCPAYRGLCYLVFQEIELQHYGNRMPNVTCLWATDAPESLIVKKLAYWDDDTDVSQFVPATEGGAVAIDWARMAVYALSYLGVVRTFDIRTGLCINKVDVVDLMIRFGYGTIFGDQVYSTGSWPFGSIGAEPGGDVYITNIPKLHFDGGSSFHWDPVYIWRLSPGLDEVIGVVQLPRPFLVNDWVTNLKVFDLIGPSGLYVMAVGRYLIGEPFLVDPEFGYFEYLPVANSSIFGTSWFLVGKQDELAGTVDVWIFNASAFSEDLQVYKAFVTGNDVSQIVEMGNYNHMGVITPADYGVTPGGAYNAGGTKVIYDASDDTLIFSDFLLDASLKWSPSLGVVWTQSRYTLDANTFQNYVDTQAGRWANGWVNGSYSIWVDETFTGTQQSVYNFTQIIAAGGVGAPSSTYGYNSSLNGIIFASTERSDSQLYVAYLQRYTGGEVRVADIIADLCNRVGLTDDMIDVSLVTDTTIGYKVDQEKSAGQCVQDLCHTYMIDMVESDYLLKFVPKGQAGVATITQDDLAPIEASNMGHFWEAKRAQEQEMPLQFNIRHNDPALDWQANATYAKRTALPVPTTFSKRVATVDLPVIATNTEARHIAEKWLYTMWAERDTFKTKLGWKHLFLDPTDTVTVNFDNGDSYTVRITSTNLDADLSIDLELCSEDATTYTESTSPGALVSFTPQELEPAGFYELLQFNVPLLQDSDDLGGLQSRIYFAAGPTQPMDSSATSTLYKSTDAVTWSNFATSNGFANWGRATTKLADTPAKFATDYKNTVTVMMVSGSTTPASCTYAEMMSGSNAALLGSEIIQFQNVSTNSNGSITISGIARGRRGTEWATSTHRDGEVFVLLEAIDVVGTRLELSELNVSEFYKLVPLNSVLDRVPSERFTYLGYDMFPYAPVRFERENSGGSPPDLTLTWKRRTRIGGWMVDGSDTVALNEASEAYEAYVLADSSSIDSFDPTNAGTYVRKFSGLSSATCTYTAAEQATDGFDQSADTLYLVVYQLSAVTGRGFRGYEAIPAF